MGDFAIEARELTKHYGRRVAVQDLTMDVPRGEIFGFLGPNGAGKTTAVKMLLGLVHPSSGNAALLGEPLGSIQTRRRIGYLPELFRYQEWLTPLEILEWHAALLRIQKNTRRAAVLAILERVGLNDRARDRVGTFSKGMQQRLGIGVALVGEPDIVFFDEPTSALDPVGRADVRRLVAELKARGTTVFLNSHLLAEVESVCDRVAVIDGGEILAIGGLRDLLGRAAVRVELEPPDAPVRAFLAMRGATLEDGTALFHNVAAGDIPEIVTNLVKAGARIRGVVPARMSLEERFLELLGNGR